MPKSSGLAPALAGLAAVTVAVTGCHSTTTTTPQVKQSASSEISSAASHEQTLLQGCLAKGTILTHAGRVAFEQCARGGMTVAAFQSCADKQLASVNVLTKSGRDQWLLLVGKNCASAS